MTDKDRIKELESKVKALEATTPMGMLQQVYETSDPELQKFIRAIVGDKP